MHNYLDLRLTGLHNNEALADAQSIPFRYYNVIRNCGDAITSYILRNRFGLIGRVAKQGEQHLLAIGSILFMANQNSHVWGSGVLSPQATLPQIDPKKIYALRGKKTVENLRSRGYKISDVPLGDPGILVKHLIRGTASLKYKAAIVPHHSGFDSKKWDAARSNDELCIVDMMDDTLLPLKQIAESEVVISQSLHGLIFAAALGKPYLWVSGHSSEAWNFKFLDWFSTCENPQDEPVLLTTSLEEMLKMAAPRPCTASHDDLCASFPRHLIDSAPQANGDFHLNRLLSPAHVFVGSPTLTTTAAECYTPHQFIEHVRGLRSRVFFTAPEPTYLAISHLGAKFTPSRLALLAGQRHLDQNREAIFAWYPGDVEALASPTFRTSSVTFDQAYLRYGTMLLRPDGQLSLKSKFVHL